MDREVDCSGCGKHLVPLSPYLSTEETPPVTRRLYYCPNDTCEYYWQLFADTPTGTEPCYLGLGDREPIIEGDNDEIRTRTTS